MNHKAQTHCVEARTRMNESLAFSVCLTTDFNSTEKDSSIERKEREKKHNKSEEEL